VEDNVMTTEERKSPFRAMLNAFDLAQEQAKAATEDRERARLHEMFGVKPPFGGRSYMLSRKMNLLGQEYTQAEKRLQRLGRRLARKAAAPPPEAGEPDGGGEKE
jgi:hypothetical protein